MNSLFHALNIGTLAAWLSVVGFGTVGVILPGGQLVHDRVHFEKLEVLNVTPDITVSDEAPTPAPEQTAAASPEIPPAPPALPDIPSTAPLPEIPDLQQSPSTAPAVRPAPQHVSSRKPTATTSGNPASSGAPGNGRVGNGMSLQDRLAAGHTPAPDFPPFSRRNRQEGKVVVEFCVNSDGRVTAAFAKNPSRWPLLNQTAVRTVLSWSFPPGDFITLERTITFKLD
ncbi:MAG: TonB family protein [Luteolibacter sp.]